ncbi:hypothetical protein ES708_11242 [subsurface metagenome]
MGGDEILQHAQALAQPRFNREVDDFTRGVGHQAAHARHLPYLGDVTLGSRGCHHVDTAVAVEGLGDDIGNLIRGLYPDADGIIILFVLGD